MADIFLKYDDTAARRVLELIGRRGNDLNPAMIAASLEMHKDVIQRFQDEEDEKGNPWVPLKPSTILQRRNENKSSIKKLRDSGRLIGSITPRHGVLFAAVTAGGTSKDGEDVEYAAVHNFGHTFPPMTIKPKKKKALHWGGKPGFFSKGHQIPSRRVPARPFMRDLSESAHKKIFTLLTKHLMTGA